MRARLTISRAVAVLVAALSFPALASGPAGATPTGAGTSLSLAPPRVEVLKGGVVPRESVPDSVRPLRIFLRLRADRRSRVQVRIVKSGSDRVVRRFYLRDVGERARWHRLRWDGRTVRGRLAPAGRYVITVKSTTGPIHRAARFRLHGHVHPIAGPHGTRGAVGRFGAGRNGGRTHEGFDATARCGTPLVAVRSGRILKVANDPALKGYHVVLKGEAERRTYLYAHLRRPATVRKGQRVRAGRRLGAVGLTGNAAGTPCHLHLEVRTHGRLLDPWPILNSWEW